ncbi:glutamate receptor ionotropic, kainate 2-like [Rhipicephalus microplus]|uniref:glutamate receptor ionotropic, kainate 2-like n=1 Tax=Rhipicephalus microplus TaxID=6941 RepID=UPI003F6CD5F6
MARLHRRDVGRLVAPSERRWQRLTFFIAALATTLTEGSYTSAALPDVIQIGVVYDHAGSSEEEKLLWQMLDQVNLNASDDGEKLTSVAGNTGTQELANSSSRAPHLSLAIERLDPEDTFQSAKKVYRLLEKGVVAVLGPRKSKAASLVGSACAGQHVPHIILSREFQPNAGVNAASVSVSMAPPHSELDKALQDLVKAQRWKSFTIVYEKSEALVRLRGLLHLTQPGSLPIPVSLRLLSEKMNPGIVLRDIAKNGESNVVLDVATHKLGDLLRHAQRVGIVNEYHNFIVTTLDLHTVDLTALQNSGTNLTGFMLLKREVWEQDIGAVREKYTKTGLYPLFLTHRVSWKQIRTDAAITQDALIVFVRAIQSLAKARALEAPPRFSCRTRSMERNLTQSNMLKEAVRKIRFSGLSGPLWLDSSGQRRNVSLYVAKLKRTGLTSVGTWSMSSGLNITRAEKLFEDEILSVLKNKTLRITTILTAPYVMLKKSAHKLEGNDRFQGYCVDLLREISATLGFRYRLKLVRDGAYGTRDSQGRWNGIMRELVDMEADLAIGDLTITSEREQSVDFTMPFMTLGVSILYKKTDQKRSLLFFLSPLSGDVWFCVAGACVTVSVILCCVARAQSAVCRGNSAVSRRYGCCCCCRSSLSRSDGDWYTETDSGRARLDIIKGQEAVGSSELQRDTLYSGSWRNCTLPTVRSDFTLPNSCWFIVSAIMRQGCGIFPRAASARIIAATWWIFSFVLVSCYTANLTAFLTKERLLSPIESAEDLAKQSAVRYGCVRSGSTHALFKEWRHDTYEMMRHAMKDDLVSSIAEGIGRVERGGYAFLMESTSIEYVVRRRCQLKQIGGLLDTKGYGIATPHGSPYRNILSSTLLRLQERGTLRKFKDRWWKVRDPLKPCPTTEAGKSRTDAASELGLRTVGGVFVVLLAGLGLACLIAFAELFCKARLGRS